MFELIMLRSLCNGRSLRLIIIKYSLNISSKTDLTAKSTEKPYQARKY